MPYGFVDRIAKLIPFELGITLDDALEKEPELQRLYEAEDEVRDLIDLARSLEGLARNAGKHAGGVVIAPSVLTDFAPLYCEAGGGSVVTQFDKDDVEAAGLVKFDFLGLRTLTIIDWAVRPSMRPRAAGGRGAARRSARCRWTMRRRYALLKACRTTAVFQLESRGMKDLIRRLQPDCFEDIVALVALFRPGPLQSGMVDDFIARKHGRNEAPIDYLHPSLEPVLKPTYGVILYQEQVMQIAQMLAGYTLGGADLLRRAMGKKKPEEMAQQRSVFVDGAVARGVRERARRAHLRPDGEVRRLRLQQVALGGLRAARLPDRLAQGALPGGLHGGGAVGGHGPHRQGRDPHRRMRRHGSRGAAARRQRLALRVRGRRRAAHPLRPRRDQGRRRGAVEATHRGAQRARALREPRGPVPPRSICTRVNRRVLEALIRSGSLDALGANRATLMERLAAAMQLGDQSTRAHAAGQNDLFGGLGARGTHAPAPQRAAELPEWSEAVRLAGERETLGLYLTGHPIGASSASLPRFVAHRIGDLVGERPVAGREPGRFSGGKPVTVAGLIVEMRKRGPRVILMLDDRSGRHRGDAVRGDLAAAPRPHRQGRTRAGRGHAALRRLQRRLADRGAAQFRARAAARAGGAPLVLRSSEAELPRLTERLAAILEPWRPGPCPVTVQYTGATASGALDLGERVERAAARELLEQLEGLLGSGALEVLYAGPAASPGGAFSADGR